MKFNYKRRVDITKAKQQRLGDTIIFNFILSEKKAHTYPADTTLTMSFRLSLTEGVSTYVSSTVGSLSPAEIQYPSIFINFSPWGFGIC